MPSPSKPPAGGRPARRARGREPRAAAGARDARGARRAIAAIVADLVDVHDRLLALRAALPEAPEGAAEEGTELVGAIECVVHDDLRPAIRSLRLAAALPADR